MAATIEGPEAIVVTLGAAGAVIVAGTARTHVPAPRDGRRSHRRG